jgi:hypothetical protein
VDKSTFADYAYELIHSRFGLLLMLVDRIAVKLCNYYTKQCLFTMKALAHVR